MIDSFEYLTFSVIDSNINNCFNELSFYVNEKKKEYNIEEAPVNFDKIYSVSPPGGAHFSKFLIWEPQNLPGKTCFFSNNQDGRYTLILNYCKTFEHKAFMIAFSNKRELYPAFIFYYFDYSKGNQIERIISLIKDGERWEFYTGGPLQPFEDDSYYQNRLKTKRFNKEILLSYLNKLGVDIESPKFWQSRDGNAFYFEQLHW